MKKIFVLFMLPILIVASFSGCKKQSGLTEYVSELRSEVYACESNADIKAAYGFKEDPYINDGKVGDKVYALTFYISGKDSDAADRFIFLTYKGEEYKAAFTLNPVTGTLTAKAEIENFNEKEFTAILCEGSERQTLVFKSSLPDKTLSLSAALDAVEKSQTNITENYRGEDGSFTAEIYARVIVKDGAPYWFIGFASGNDRMKALLVNGLTGELLATREVL